MPVFNESTGDLNFTPEDRLFLGDNIDLEFEILQDDGEPVYLDALDANGNLQPNPDKLPQDVSGWDFAFYVRLKDTSADPPLLELRSDVSPLGISITGTFNADRATNTQRVLVTLDDTDTDSNSSFPQKKKTYRHSLKRMNDDFEKVLVRGNLVLLKATTPEE